MKSAEFVLLLVAMLNKLANVCNKSFTLAYLFQHAKVSIANKVYPLNNAASWENIPSEKYANIRADQWGRDSVIEILTLKANVMLGAIACAKASDRVKVAKAFMPKADETMLKDSIKLALAVNSVFHYDTMKAAEKTVKAAKSTTTEKTY